MTIAERDQRRRTAFRLRGIDYDEYCRDAEQKKAERAAIKQQHIESNMYHMNHEDNIQFGCCCPDTLIDCSQL